MKPLLALLGLVLTVGVATDADAQRGGGGGGTPSATCRPADDLVVDMLTAVRTMVTSTDSVIMAARQRQGLPAVPTSQVSYVTDNSVCAKAEKTYTSNLTGTTATPSLQVYVIKVGNVYVVWDPVQVAGEFTTAMTVNNSYKFVAKYSL
jgi:hypothetical protein